MCRCINYLLEITQHSNKNISSKSSSRRKCISKSIRKFGNLQCTNFIFPFFCILAVESDQPSEDLKCSVSEKTIQGGLWNFGSFFWYILISGLSVWWFCVQLQFSAYFSCIYSQRLALLWIFMTLALSYLCPNSFASAFENDSHPASEMVSFFHSLLLDGSFLFCSFF